MGQKQAAKKRILKKATSYDLAKILSAIKNVGEGNLINNENIGLVYSSMVINSPKQCLLSYLERKEYRGHVDTVPERFVKKRFQEQSRSDFYTLFQDLNIGNKVFSELKDNYKDNLTIVFSGLIDVSEFSLNTIEGQIVRTISDNNISFFDVGNALVKGAQDYVSQRQNDGAGVGKYKLFLEYNRILDNLKGI